MIAGREGTPGRERNPEQSRERLLSAALVEFAAHGYAGARVEAIAERAGLNRQLISHHFGGKLGLYQAVMNRRRSTVGGEISMEPGQMPDGLPAFYDRAARDPEWIRVLLWETLEREQLDQAPRSPGQLDDRAALYRERIAWIESEQAAGRLPDDLEPNLLFLSLAGAALYPLLLPALAEIVTGEDPTSGEFGERYRAHLRKLAAHLMTD
jgi:TetR/AcrR family transcriptional regulator